jgi:hypothetical protein
LVFLELITDVEEIAGEDVERSARRRVLPWASFFIQKPWLKHLVPVAFVGAR